VNIPETDQTEATRQAVPTAGPAPAERPRARTVTFRAVALGLLLMPVNAYWIVMMESVRYSAHPTTVSLFFNCVFFLVVLTGLNQLLVRLRPRWAFAQGELLLVYAMLGIGSCMAGHDMGQVLVPTLTWPFGQATPSNGYARLFADRLPRWVMGPPVSATDPFYLGHGTFYTRAHILEWLPSALIWTSFIVVLLFVMQCINVLIRKQWTDNERLSYPLTRIPLEITDSQPFGRGLSDKPLTRSVIFWIGFAVAAGIDGINSLNYYYPAIPAIGTPGHGQSFIDLHNFVSPGPWSAIGWTPLSFYPFVIGLGMLMPLDFLFSSWFFYLTWKLQSVLTVMCAWDADPRMPYAGYQGLGAYLLFLVSTLWLSRRYFGQVVRCALGRPSEIDDRDEPLRYRWAFLGLALGFSGLVAFSVALGLAWWLAVLFFLLYLALALAITRMRAELGTPVHDLTFTGPDLTLTDLLGTQSIGPAGLGALSIFFWFNRAYRAHPMPVQLEAFQMADQTVAKREMKGWFWVLLLAGGFGMLCAFWAILACYYHFGALAKVQSTFGSEAWNRLSGWIQQPQGPNGRVGIAIIVGFCFAGFLQLMRVRFSWWPFHPLAYAVSGAWEMNLLWAPLLIAWLIKALLLRYGGVRVYRASLPFFYGLILGQFIPGSLLNIWGIIRGVPTYQFWQ
jgi:hypothetical protein